MIGTTLSPLARQIDRHAGFELGASDGQRSLDVGDVGCSGQVLQNEILKTPQIWRYAFEDEIRLARQHMAFAHDVPFQQPVFEGAQIAFLVLLDE